MRFGHEGIDGLSAPILISACRTAPAEVISPLKQIRMQDTSLFIPESISKALSEDLVTGQRALADALDLHQLDGRFVSANAGAGGRRDDRLHLRIVLHVAAPIIQVTVQGTPPVKLED